MEHSPTAQPVSHHGSRWWIFTTIMLCCYGFFKEFKPSEPYLTPYLTDNSTNSSKNFTKTVVNGDIYPFWSYSYLVAIPFVALLTDVVRYKPVILLESLSYLTTRVLLIWGTSVLSMQMMQVVYGVATATEIAYYSYIYTAVSLQHFKRVTSYVRAARLFGQAMAGIFGQILISTHALTYLQLNYFSFASVCIACVFAVFLPNVWVCSCKDLAHCVTRDTSTRGRKKTSQCSKWIIKTIRRRWKDLKKFYSVLSLLRWSVWWALATCGELQIGNYVQSLWKDIAVATGESYLYNGLVEALATLFSAGAAFMLSLLTVNWPVWGEITIGLLSLLDSVVLLIAAMTSALWVAYVCHILYRVTFSFLITIATAQLAYAVNHDSYALIFGLNTFAALCLQSLLTLAVADERGLDLPVRTQFIVYSGYYYLLTLIFVGAGVYKLTSTGWFKSLRICCHEPNLAAMSHSSSRDEEVGEGTGIQNVTKEEEEEEEEEEDEYSKLV